MLTANLTTVFESEWSNIDSLTIGPAPSSLPTADRYCLVQKDGVPFKRLDLFARTDGECFFREEVLIWNELIVIGFGSRASVVNLENGAVKTCDLEGYFGYLYPHPGHLLIASASSLRCVDDTGDLLWQIADLGIDGVIVNRLENGLIYGEGEWDPPGGWKPFVLDLKTGHPLKDQYHSVVQK